MSPRDSDIFGKDATRPAPYAIHHCPGQQMIPKQSHTNRPSLLTLPTNLRDRGNPLDSTDFGKKVLKERGLQEDPKPEAESRIKFNPVNLFLFFQPVGHKTTKPQKARSDTRAKQQKEAEKEAVYEEYKNKAKDVSITYLLAYSFLGGRFKKRYDDKVKAANDRRRAAGKPTK
ncbi:MAG: hypothetical protein Q9191_006697 [Dirinaria sp. TL-2023a]